MPRILVQTTIVALFLICACSRTDAPPSSATTDPVSAGRSPRNSDYQGRWASSEHDALLFLEQTTRFLNAIPDNAFISAISPFLRKSRGQDGTADLKVPEIRTILARPVGTISNKGNRYIIHPAQIIAPASDEKIPKWPLVLYHANSMFRIDLAQSKRFAPPQPDDPAPQNITLSPRQALDGIPGEGEPVATISFSNGERLQCRLLVDTAPMNVAAFVSLARGLRNVRMKKAVPETTVSPGQPSEWAKIPFWNGVVMKSALGGRALATKLDRVPGFTIPDEFDREIRHDRPGLLTTLPDRVENGQGAFALTGGPVPAHDDIGSIFGICDPEATARIFTERLAAGRAGRKLTITGVDFHRL